MAAVDGVTPLEAIYWQIFRCIFIQNYCKKVRILNVLAYLSKVTQTIVYKSISLRFLDAFYSYKNKIPLTDRSCIQRTRSLGGLNLHGSIYGQTCTMVGDLPSVFRGSKVFKIPITCMTVSKQYNEAGFHVCPFRFLFFRFTQSK